MICIRKEYQTWLSRIHENFLKNHALSLPKCLNTNIGQKHFLTLIFRYLKILTEFLQNSLPVTQNPWLWKRV